MSPFSDRNFLCVDHHRGEGKMTSGFSKSDSNIVNSGSECHSQNNQCRFSILVSKVKSHRGSCEALSRIAAMLTRDSQEPLMTLQGIVSTLFCHSILSSSWLSLLPFVFSAFGSLSNN